MSGYLKRPRSAAQLLRLEATQFKACLDALEVLPSVLRDTQRVAELFEELARRNENRHQSSLLAGLAARDARDTAELLAAAAAECAVRDPDRCTKKQAP